MDAALAGAARILLRGDFLFVEPATTLNVGSWRRDRLARTSFARVGNRSSAKERCSRYHRAVLIHAQSALPRKLCDGSRLHRCLRTTSAGNSIRGIISGHLCSGNARRIGDPREIVWRELPKLLESSAVVLAALIPL